MTNVHDLGEERFVRQRRFVACGVLARACVELKNLAAEGSPLEDLREAQDAIARAVDEVAAAG